MEFSGGDMYQIPGGSWYSPQFGGMSGSFTNLNGKLTLDGMNAAAAAAAMSSSLAPSSLSMMHLASTSGSHGMSLSSMDAHSPPLDNTSQRTNSENTSPQPGGNNGDRTSVNGGGNASSTAPQSPLSAGGLSLANGGNVSSLDAASHSQMLHHSHMHHPGTSLAGTSLSGASSPLHPHTFTNQFYAGVQSSLVSPHSLLQSGMGGNATCGSLMGGNSFTPPTPPSPNAAALQSTTSAFSNLNFHGPSAIAHHQAAGSSASSGFYDRFAAYNSFPSPSYSISTATGMSAPSACGLTTGQMVMSASVPSTGLLDESGALPPVSAMLSNAQSPIGHLNSGTPGASMSSLLAQDEQQQHAQQQHLLHNGQVKQEEVDEQTDHQSLASSGHAAHVYSDTPFDWMKKAQYASQPQPGKCKRNRFFIANSNKID